MRLLAVLLAFLAACGADGRPRVRLATTTSTENSGLIKHLLAGFDGVDVQVIAVGTGQALKLGERGDADLVLVHARSREAAFMAAGHGVERRDIMWNDFVIVGPPADPAGIKGLKSATEAFARIRQSSVDFVSRGDDSGTHIREQSIWEAVYAGPSESGAYLEAGQGMGKCLIMANERGAYVLSDRGTYLAFRKKLDLVVLCEGDAALRNPYGVILVKPERAGARKLLDYLTSAAGQKRIGEFRVDGERLFHPAALPK